jgi:hypothetical protein
VEKLLIKYQISLIFESSIEMKVFMIEFGRLLKLLVSWALGLTPHEKTLFLMKLAPRPNFTCII